MVLLEGAVRVEHETEGMQGFPWIFPCAACASNVAGKRNRTWSFRSKALSKLQSPLRKRGAAESCCCCFHKRGIYVSFGIARGGTSKFGNITTKNVKFDWSMDDRGKTQQIPRNSLRSRMTMGQFADLGRRTQKAHTLAHLIN